MTFPAAAGSSAISAFHTPGWAAECYVPAPTEGPVHWSLTCVTPNDGFTITIGAHGRPSFQYNRHAKGYRDAFAAKRLLRFGQHWNFKVRQEIFHCVSRRTGLTCWNRARHGWWLGRYHGYRIF